MAVWSEINKSNVILSKRFDAERYKPQYVKNEILLNRVPNKRLKYYIEEISGGATPKGAKYQNSGIRFVRVQNIRENFIDLSDVVYISEEIHNGQLFRSQIKENDVLLTITGVSYGNSSVAHTQVIPANMNQHSVRISLKPMLIPEFLSTFLISKFGKLQSDSKITGDTRPALTYSEIANYIIPDIDYAEQLRIKEIVQISTELRLQSENLYYKATQLLEKELGLDNSDLDQYSSKYVSTFKELISGNRIDSEYFNPKVKEIVRRISSLQHTRIGLHFTIKNGFPWNSQRFLEDNSGEPVIRIRDIKQGYIENEKLTSLVRDYAASVNFPKAQPGDVVIGMDGIKYFLSSIVEEPCLVNQRVCHISPKEGSQISSEYVSFIINSEVGQAQLLRDMTIATTVGHVTNSNVAKLIIPVVSKDFHDKITSLVRESIYAQKESKRLLEQAKTEVETLIEQAAQAS